MATDYSLHVRSAQPSHDRALEEIDRVLSRYPGASFDRENQKVALPTASAQRMEELRDRHSELRPEERSTRGGGDIEIDVTGYGYCLSASTSSPFSEALLVVMEDLAARLGTVLTEAELGALVEEEDEEAPEVEREKQAFDTRRRIARGAPQKDPNAAAALLALRETPTRDWIVQHAGAFDELWDRSTSVVPWFALSLKARIANHETLRNAIRSGLEIAVQLVSAGAERDLLVQFIDANRATQRKLEKRIDRAFSCSQFEELATSIVAIEDLLTELRSSPVAAGPADRPPLSPEHTLASELSTAATQTRNPGGEKVVTLAFIVDRFLRIVAEHDELTGTAALEAVRAAIPRPKIGDLIGLRVLGGGEESVRAALRSQPWRTTLPNASRRESAFLELYDEDPKGIWAGLSEDKSLSEEFGLLVARELMRRVRANVEVIAARLASLGWHPTLQRPEPCGREPVARLEAALEARAAEAGLDEETVALPVTLRAFYEEVGGIDLLGWVWVSSGWPAAELLSPLFVLRAEAACHHAVKRKGRLFVPVAPNDAAKYQPKEGRLVKQWYAAPVTGGLDAVMALDFEADETSYRLVPYLRKILLERGGFCNADHDLVCELSSNLQPF